MTRRNQYQSQEENMAQVNNHDQRLGELEQIQNKIILSHKYATINYLLSEKGRKASVLTGGNGKQNQSYVVPVTPELLTIASVSPQGDITINVGCDLNKAGKAHDRFSAHFDAPQSIENLIGYEISRVSNYNIDEENKKQIRAYLKTEKIKWIENYGSPHLQNASNQGYDCQRLYVAERVTKELPNFKIDFDGKIKYKPCASPTEKALAIADQINQDGYLAVVIWLTDKELSCEAVVICDYLEKYTAILENLDSYEGVVVSKQKRYGVEKSI